MTEPRCPAHNTDMVPATHWIKLDGKSFPKPVHVCTVADCLQAYAAEGYHLIAATEPVGNPIEVVLKKK